jgi:sugar lactone lactonase YvrE
MESAWDLPHALKYPESIVYDRARQVIYVSNFFNGGHEFISRVKVNGEIDELEWITGLKMPTGMCIFDDRLYAIDRTGLVKIDIESATIVDRYSISGAMFINDIAFDDSGNAYVSDTRRNVIYKFSDGEFEVWLEGGQIIQPNGLCVDRNLLIVGNSGDGALKSVRLSDRTISTVASLGAGSILDGIAADGGGGYIASDYNGRLFRVEPSGKKTLLLNTTTPNHFCADFAYITDKNLIVIPTLYDNRLMAYKYTASQ